MPFSFNLKTEVMDIDDTVDGGGEPVHPAKVLMMDWDGTNVVYVVVPLEVFEPYKDAVKPGTFVSIVGELHGGARWRESGTLPRACASRAGNTSRRRVGAVR